MAMRTTVSRWGRTTEVRPEHLGKVALLGLVLHIGVTIGRRGSEPVVIVLPPPLEAPAPVVVKAEAKVKRAVLPSFHDELPDMSSPTFARQVKAMGLNPKDVAMFAQMMRTKDLAAFRR